MNRLTIDYGIDLGTTNSAIAVLKGTEVDVFKNHLGKEYIPSAIWIDPKNRLHGGQTAKERLEDDTDNAAAEFKLLMGIPGQLKVFQRSGKKMTPPIMSAWVLKTLKREVQRQTGEDIKAAVITIPAAFDMPQRDATKDAAEKAGFLGCPLLQEPVAAGLAHGFQSEKDNVYWLVYDLGGGTFDAAVIQVRGGEIQVVGHAGDNHLGGKIFDWDIVEKLFLPTLLKTYPNLSDFRRGNPHWRAAFAKLKWWAEDSKIKLSTARSIKVTIDPLCQDDRGNPVVFNYDLTRGELENLIEPHLIRTVNISQKVLKETRLSTTDIEKIVLVGGPTQIPFLRQYLIDSNDGLGIPVDFRIDPMTVVAHGAAVFAGTQRLPASAMQAPQPGVCALEVDYKPVGSDPEPFVGGRALGTKGQDFTGYTVEFIKAETTSPWRSGKIELLADGRFLTNLWADKGTNDFLIELCDTTGSRVTAVPDRLTYTIGVVFNNPPLTHSLGIAMANNEVDLLFPKGTPLPNKARSVHQTIKEIRQQNEGDWLTIPIIEGESKRADRNQHIGSLVISGKHISRNIPAGSKVEIRLEVDADHLVKVRGYFPILDQEFPTTISYSDYHKRSQDPNKLNRDISQEQKRLAEIREKTSSSDDTRTQATLQKIETENVVQQIQSLHNASAEDPEAAAACQNRLRDLRELLDEIEDNLEWPELLKEAQEALELLRTVIEKYAPEARQKADALQRETDIVIDTHDPGVLKRKIQELDRVRIQILQEQPGFWALLLSDLEKRRSMMKDSSRANQLFSAGQEAMNNDNVAGLKAAVQQLFDLLPDEQRDQMPAFGASTQR